MRRMSAAPAVLDQRTIQVRVRGGQNAEQKNNSIKTSRYTAWNFVFLNLYKQFHRAANVYFFLIMLLQLWTEVSITQGDPSMAIPLAFVLLVTAVKDALEDYSRHVFDKVENNRTVEVLDHVDESGESVFVAKSWSSIKVGSVVRLKNRERIPADIALLSCSDTSSRVVYVMTAGLDGETNLKQRTVAPDLPNNISELDENTTISCDGPNKLLESFEATLAYKNQAGEIKKVPLGPKNILLRGSQMRNSAWAIGVVVYAGSETKLHMNAATESFKTSSCMEQAQQLMLFIFAMQCLFCVGTALVSSVLRVKALDLYYLHKNETKMFVEFILRFFNYLLIFTNFIPISLLVTIDMVKFGQGFFISWDLGMYHPESNRSTKVNCSELNEELGCIEHIFTDKTGTLTANVMKFKACCCNETLFRVSDETSLQINAKGVEDRKELSRLFQSLALNHSVIPEANEKDPTGPVIFSASSPDEGALVQAAKENGFALVERRPKSVVLEQSNGAVEYRVLQSLEFTSDRKRSSVIVEDPSTGEIRLHCKGADNVILERLRGEEKGSSKTKATLDTLNVLAAEGLRTLCIATKVLDRKLYDDWSARYHEATVALVNRQELVAQMEDEIEVDLELIGCTAIEDKLQEEVAESISAFREANIKVWMLTGDKVDTAVNIGFSCALWTHEMDLLYCLFDDVEYSGITREMLADKIAKIKTRIEQVRQSGAKKGFCLILDTKGVYALSHFKEMASFLEIANQCESVICARVSPDQKATIVMSVRESDPQIKTLSIGDGANDVPMIQKAHVGIGIYGQEGLQAANAADFAIARFKFLKRLLFVHGRWSARRVGVLICYMFYKNAILVLPQFFYAFVCLASGQNFYLDYPFYQGYNLVFTSFPILFFGIFDQDLSDRSCMAHPKLYQEGSMRTEKAKFFSKKIFWRWIGEGFVQSALITFLVMAIHDYWPLGITSGKGHSHDIWLVGTIVHLCVCIVVTLRLLLENKTVNVFMSVSYIISFVLWFGTCWIWSETKTIPYLFSSTNQAQGVFTTFQSLTSWLSTLVTCVIAILPSFLMVTFETVFHPPQSHLVHTKELRTKTPRLNAIHPVSP